MKKKLWVVDYQGYAQPFKDTFEIVFKKEDSDVIMFTGGADILPSHYGQQPGKFTSCSPHRDGKELEAYHFGLAMNKSFIGICRGAQLLTALNGGSLIQHVDNHTSRHSVKTFDGLDLMTSSLHHQMMYPYEIPEHKILAWSSPISDTYLNGDDVEVFKDKPKLDPEVVYYPNIKALCIQGHPEMMPSDHPFVKWCNKQAAELL